MMIKDGILLFLLASINAMPATAAQVEERVEEVDLSPAAWEPGEAEKFYLLNKRMGAESVLARGEHGVVAGTTGAPAIRVGIEALRRGGTAADAALASSLTQISLAAGSWVSYAGILTMVYYDAGSKKYYNLNAGYNTVLAEDDPMTIPRQTGSPALEGNAKPAPSGRTALVPGYMAGVEAAHDRFGKLPFEALFSAAVHYAEDGFEFTEFHEALVKGRARVLSRLPATKAVFTKEDGSWYAAGDHFRQPALAKTLRKVAKLGAGYMYTGDWAQKCVQAVKADGGRMTMEDMRDYEVIWSDPLVISYGDFEVHAHGLPAQGGAHVAEALNLCTQADIAGMGHYSESPEAFFWTSQITNLFGLSFVPQVTGRIVLGGADPSLAARATVEHAERLWPMMKDGRFLMTKVPAKKDPGHSDAVVAIDQWGNMAAVVHTINTAAWGETGIFVDGVSIPDSATFQQQLISETGPGNRLPDPTEPLIIARNGKPVHALASIGSGLHQKTITVLLNLMDHGMSLKEAIDAGSFHLPAYEGDGGSKPQVFEGDFSDELLEGIKELGLDVVVLPGNLSNRAPRGYVVGASAEGDGGLQSVNTGTLNGTALGY